MGTTEAKDLLIQAEQDVFGITARQGPLELDYLADQLVGVFGDDYGLGEVTGVQLLSGGYANLSFAVDVRIDGRRCRRFVRKYRVEADESEILFEHALLDHLHANGFSVTPAVHRACDGASIAVREDVIEGQPRRRFFAVFDFLQGDDRYAWFDNRMSRAELLSTARVAAGFHRAAWSFDPGDLRRVQEPVMEFVPALRDAFLELTAQGHGRAFEGLFGERLDDVLTVIDRCRYDETALRAMPYMAIHCDLHPGNQKYRGTEVVGLFDLDDAKFDYRLFDVALALANFCTSWEAADDGALMFDSLAAFLDEYQREALRGGPPGPLNEAELAGLRRMLANANLNLLSWEVFVYYADDDPDVDEYMTWLRHHLRAMDFIEDHRAELENVLARLPRE